MTDNIKNDRAPISSKGSRRKLLKTAGLTTGVVAGVAWHKPVLKSVITPVHAQTSGTTTAAPTTAAPTTAAPTTTAGPMMAMLTGSTSGTDPFAMLMKSNESDSIASKVMDAVVPPAHALLAPSLSLSGLMMTQTAADYVHCVTVSVSTMSNVAPTTADITIDGPVIYYGYQGFQGGAYYYSSTADFSGSATATLSQNGNVYDFTVMIGDIEVNGELDNTLAASRGTLTYTGSTAVNGSMSQGYAGFMNSPVLSSSGGYGAYWETSSSAQCAAGTGPALTVVVGNLQA